MAPVAGEPAAALRAGKPLDVEALQDLAVQEVALGRSSISLAAFWKRPSLGDDEPPPSPTAAVMAMARDWAAA